MRPEDIERLKELLPTSLGSAEIREQLAADILRRSVFSARMASASYLAKIREVCTQMLEGGINQAEARTRLLVCLQSMGYATDGSPTDLADPASERRLNLIVDTQRQMAASVAQLESQNAGTLDQFPGWVLTRLASRALPREDWQERWNQAGDSVGWEGARQGVYHGSGTGFGFAALKSSPIWQALGEGTGGFNDALGNPYPPFAYSSGMGWLQLDRAECEQLGLIAPDETAAGPADFSLSPTERDIADAAKRYGFDESFFDDLLK